MSVTSFPAKVLLFGEYTILNGSKALALPYEAYSGKWTYSLNGGELRAQSQASLKKLGLGISDQYVDKLRLLNDIDRGLWFESSIPQGYGLGSSGALIAALVESYGTHNQDSIQIKTSFARLEDFFHGSSSGLDPLVSHLQKPLLIHSPETVEILHEKINLSGFFLLNTGKPRQTGPLVSIYMEKLKDPEFKKGCAHVLAKDVNLAIGSLINNEPKNIFHHLWHISKFQWDFFPEMIPTQMRGPWANGLDTGDYVLKLCGAGGGGFLLGYSDKLNFEQMQKLIIGHELKELI